MRKTDTAVNDGFMMHAIEHCDIESVYICQTFLSCQQSNHLLVKVVFDGSNLVQKTNAYCQANPDLLR